MEERLKSFAAWLTEEGKSENTVKTYIGALGKFFEWLLENENKVSPITHDHVQDYMNHLENLQRSAATIEKAFSAISVYAKFLNRSDLTSNISRLEKEKNTEAPDSLDKTERNLLLQELESDGDLRNTVIVYTLLHTGIRISELCALDVNDVRLKANRGDLLIRSTNGDVKRVIPLSKELQKYMKRYLATLDSKQSVLFLSSVNKRISTRGVQYMLKKYNVNPHKLRHTFCAELVQNGVDLSTVAELAGHSDVNVTKRYVSEQPFTKIEDAINTTFI